jgi:diacylglycerol O-acyltransferase / wax synthase
MPLDNTNRRLSAQDASFLYGERPEAPLHIGSIAVFEGTVPYERVVENIASKIHLIPRYQQRVVPAPFNIGHPTWEWDPDFDIRKHVKRVRIDPPGNDAQLMALSAKLFEGMLDRNKPLWEIHVVEGLEGDRSALVSKVHHCLVDGVSGIELLMIVLDVSPDQPSPVAAPNRGPVPEIPPAPTRLVDAIFDNIAAELDRIARYTRGAVDAVATGDGRIRAAMRSMEATQSYLATPVARAPFNKPLTKDRIVACSEFSFAEIRAIRAECGGTVNDVVLSVLAGSLGRYLEMHGEKTADRTMRILAPVNVRREDERGALGNRVSALLVEVPVGVHDPVERLRAITERTETLKRQNVAAGTDIIGEFLSGIPPMLQSLVGILPPPRNNLANLVCTNIPGPMISLYCVGHRLLAHYPLMPIAWEMGVGCGVTSYDQKLYFGLIADPNAAPDVARLKEFLDQAFVELRSAAGVARSDLPQMGEATPQTAPARSRRSAAPSAAQPLAADTGQRAG